MTAALARLLVPAGADAAAALPLLGARALRGLADGCIAVLLPVYVLALGFGEVEVGIVSTTTLFGSALATLGIGLVGHRVAPRHGLRAAALLMLATGLGFAGLAGSWPLLLLVAFVGTLNPSAGDVSVFLPLEHARLAHAASGPARTALFARYSLAGALAAAVGALGAALPAWLTAHAGVERLAALRLMFGLYAAVGIVAWWLYRDLPVTHDASADARPAPLGPSRAVVLRLAALFSVDAFAGGLIVNALLALWLIQRFGLSLPQAAAFFFWTGLLAAGSQLAAPWVARRIGLLNTMVFTHIPSNVCLVLAALAPRLDLALALMALRAALSQMDVPTRTAFVMAVVTPPERAAAASVTAVPRSLAAAASPTVAGLLLASGHVAAPLVACGLLKIGYDLAVLFAFRRVELKD